MGVAERYEEKKKNKTTSNYQGVEYRYNQKHQAESVRNSVVNRVNTWLKNNENYVLNAQDRFSGDNTAYRSDAADWLSTITTQKNNFDKEATSIKSYMDQNKDILGDEFIKTVTDALDGNLKVQGDILSASTEDMNFWSNWDSEDAYKKYLDDQETYEKRLNYNLEAGQKNIDYFQSELNAIESIERQIAEISGMSDTLNLAIAKGSAYASGKQKDNEARLATLNQALENAYAKYGSKDALVAALTSEKQKYTLAERTQRADKLAAVARIDSEYYDPNFSNYAVVNEAFAENDDAYKYINDLNGFREDRNAYWQENAVYTDAQGNTYVNKLPWYIDGGYEDMNEDEIAIYNYYYNVGGREKANEYLESIEEHLQYRKGMREYGEMDTNVEKYLFAIYAGLDQFATNVANLFSSDTYMPTNSTQVTSGLIREDLGAGGKVVYDVLNTTANMLPSILASAAVGMINPVAGQIVGAGLMASSAAGSAKADMLNLGYTKQQANAYAAMVGIAEGSMEYLLGGISKLGGVLPDGLVGKLLTKVDNAFARTAIQLGGSMLSEGFEEGLQTIIEPWLKEIATGVDFDDPKIDEILYSSLLGALSAGILEGGGTIASEVSTYKQGQTIKQTDGALDRLMTLGSTFSADTVAGELASKVNEKTGAYTVGRLLNEAGATLSEQNQSDIKAALVNNGMAESDAATISKWLNKAVDGGIFTKSQVAALENNDVISKVFYDVIIKENSTVNQRNKAYSDLMTLADEVSNGNKANAAEKTTENLSPEEIAQKISAATGEDVDELLYRNEIQAKTASATENTSAEKAAKKGSYAVSADGKTKVGDTEVSVKEVASVKDGNVVLRLEDGSTVNASDVEFGSEGEGILYDTVATSNMSAAAANAFINGYDGTVSADQYARGFREAYRYGEYGYPMREMSTNGFSSYLTDIQKNLAYNLGKTDAKYRAESAQAKNGEAKSTKKGELHNTIQPKNERQKASLKTLGVLAKTLGIDIYTYESTAVDGVRREANGWYDPKDGSIHIDIHAGADGKGTMLFTVAHELTHHIRAKLPAKFKAFADFLFEQYGEHGVSVSELIAKRMKVLEANGRLKGMTEEQAHDLAYEEIVADACESMLADGEAVAKIAELKTKDKSLWQTIKDFFVNLVARIKAAYEGLEPDSMAGREMAKMLDVAEQLRAMWTEAVVEASEVNDLVEVDVSSESAAPLFSERTWTESEYVTERNAAAKRLAEALGVSVKKATEYIDNVNSIAKTIANDRARLDYEASSFGSAFVSNVEYGGSFDFTTLCKKRRIYTGTFSEIQKRIGDAVLTPDDILKIRNMMIEGGIEATCGLCYVEGSRANMGKFAKEFINLYKRDNPDAWTPTMVDVNTPDGVEQMRIEHPEAYEQYEYFWNHYGKLKDSDPALFASQQKPKLYEARKEYKGEILQNFKNVESIEKKNRNGGIRMQSFSDFEIVHLIDTMQIIMDMANVGLAGQAYTKVPEFADAFGNTGLKINLSLIAKGVDADGKLIFDDREGMPAETAFKLRDKYSANVGTIIVAFTDEQLQAAMADPRIDFIIPFHRSQWKKSQYGAMGLPKGTKDYTFMQNEKLIKQTYHEYQGRMVKDKASNYMPNEYWDFTKTGKENAEAYLKMCAADNKRPKFYKLLSYDGNGQYSLKEDGSTDGYWKLLVDFKMYDNDGAGSPQQAVTPEFSMNEAMTMLDEYRGGHQSYPVAHGVVDAFVEEYNAEHTVKYSDRSQADNPDIRYSLREIIGPSDNNYGVGVYLDSELLSNLTDEERVEMVKEYVKELGGSVFTAYDNNNKAVDVHIAESNQMFKNKSGKRVPVNKDLISYLGKNIKQESIALIDELIVTSTLTGKEPPRYPHGWLDNHGKNDWEYWTTYVQDKENTIWEATLNIATTTNGEKILYDIFPIKMVEQSGTSDTSTTKPIVPQKSDSVKEKFSDRDPDAISNRALLANALESATTNEDERRVLREYRSELAEADALEAELTEIRAKLKDLSFKRGPKDTEAIRKLKEDERKTINRIDIRDKKLLRLEAAKPIKDIIYREKQKAYKRAAQEGREALAMYRERSTRTQMRHKIKRVVSDLNKLLLHGTKERNVKLGLQEAVAAALDAINMDTVAADERVAKYNDLIAKATDPVVIASLTETRDRIQSQGDVLADKLEALRKAYAEIRNGEDKGKYPDYFAAEAKLIEDRIESVIKKVGNTPLRNMSYAQLEAVYDMYKMVLTTVRNANTVFKQGRVEDLQKNASAVMAELEAIPKLKEERLALGDTARGYLWNELTPYYAFERIGSKTFTDFYWEAVRGQNTYANDINEANDFSAEARKKHNYKSWDMDKIHEFTLGDGRVFRVSLKHMLSIYAYSKREQAAEHMRSGGFFFNDKETFRRKGKVLEMVKSNEAGYKIDDATLDAIKSTLTAEQRAYVDEMQAYLTEMGEKGNEVTRVLWGIDLFKEKIYFPLKSSKDFIFQANQTAQEASLKNDGMTKETVPGASNPIVLEAFDEVWASHVNRMSQYHAFVIPIENLNKIHNYGTWANSDAASVSTMLRARYSEAVNEYLTQFIQDLNGVKKSQGGVIPFLSGMFTKFKKTAVAGSLSVMVQQPTAILRAQGILDAKYFVGMPSGEKLSTKWEEVKKYAPIAIIKEIGGFDAGSGRQISEWLNADTQTGLKKAMSTVDEVAMWGAAKGDQLGWCAIWEAVKREIVHTHPSLRPGSDEFLEAVGERFTEIIVKTQVYDSTLSRSGYMRSKNELTKMMTAFMGEPTLSANILLDSFLQARRGTITKSVAARRIGATYLAILAAGLAKSAIYALRDDEDDESYLEKYLQALSGSLASDINPLTMLPGVKDIISVFDGWEIERTDMALFQDLKNAIDGLGSESKSTWKKIEDFAGAFAAFFGLPVKNLMRTGRELYNGYINIVDGITGGKLGAALVEGVTGKGASKGESIYAAIVNGDKARLDVYKSGYKTEDAYNVAVRKALRENDSRIKEAAEARYSGDSAKYERLVREIVKEGHFSQDLVIGAVNTELNDLRSKETKAEEEEKTEKVTSLYSTYDLEVAFKTGKTDRAVAVIDDLIKTKVANGMDEKAAKSSVKSSVTSYWKPLYKAAAKAKNEAEKKRIREILKAIGLYGNATDIVNTVNGWLKEKE